jgi:hypothetical protein
VCLPAGTGRSGAGGYADRRGCRRLLRAQQRRRHAERLDGVRQCQHYTVLEVAGEVGVNYFSETATYVDQTFSYSYNVLFAGVGPRFVARSPRVAAFGQFLVGVENEFETLFAIQGGGGVDVWITRTIGVRAGVDGRASYYDEERYGSWRVQTGVVLALGTR